MHTHHSLNYEIIIIEQENQEWNMFPIWNTSVK